MCAVYFQDYQLAKDAVCEKTGTVAKADRQSARAAVLLLCLKRYFYSFLKPQAFAGIGCIAGNICNNLKFQ